MMFVRGGGVWFIVCGPNPLTPLSCFQVSNAHVGLCVPYEC